MHKNSCSSFRQDSSSCSSSNTFAEESNTSNCGDDETCNNLFFENIQTDNSSGKKSKGLNWTEQETSIFIDLCIERRIVQMMDGKHHNHINIYNSLEPAMKEMGFIKSGAQMKTKLKHLKEIYFKCKRNNNVRDASRQTFPFYNAMEQLLSGRPSVQAITGNGIDSSRSSIRRLTEEQTLEAEDNLVTNVEIEVVNDNVSMPNTPPSRKTRTGRNTHMKLAENFARVFVKNQGEEMKKLMKEQMSMFDGTMRAQMEVQQKWEKEMMEKEHQHQILILENFMKGLGAMQSGNFQQYPQFSQPAFPMHAFPSTCSAYQLSPSLSRSPTSSSPFRVISSPSPNSKNSSETNTSMPSPTSPNSFTFNFANRK